MKITAKLWIGIGILAVISPLGLLLPEYFKSGSAWGEWSREEIRKLIGYVPQGLAKLSSLWPAPLPDYAFNSQETKSAVFLSLSYIFSAIIGISVVVAIVLLIGRLLIKKNNGRI